MRSARLAAVVLLVGPAALAATPRSASHAAATAPVDKKAAAAALAHAILTTMPAAQDRACAPETLDTLRSAVTAAIDKVNPSRDIAVAAVSLAKAEAPAGASCVVMALEDTADELDGDGATVDDAGKVRGFVLYEGPLPPSALHKVSNP